MMGAVVGVALASALALAACGGSSKASTALTSDTGPARSVVPPSSTTTVNITPTTQPPVAYTNTWTIDSKAPNGSTWTGTFSSGPLLSRSQLSQQIPGALLAQCNVNPQTDAVVPFKMSITDTTNGFPTSMQLALSIDSRALADLSDSEPYDQLGTGETVSVAESINGYQCSQLTGYDPDSGQPNFGLSVDDAQPQTSSYIAGILVLSGWASPNYPTGDPGFLPDIWVYVANVPISDSQWTTTSVTGPDVTHVDAFLGGWYFPVTGTGTPDCAAIDDCPSS